MSKINIHIILITSISLLILFTLVPVQASKKFINLNDPNAMNMVLAKIGDEPITLKEVVEFGRSSPAYYGFLQIPNGPDKLLKELVFEKLLLLEGKERKIPAPANQNNSLYLIRIKKELLPELPPITEKEAQKYYTQHLDEFSTPLFLRLSQIKVYFTNENKKKARVKIEKAISELKRGIPFEKVAQKYSEEPISAARGGDVGFVPASSLTPEKAKAQILKLKKGQLSPILVIGNSLTIVKLTDKQEPITDPFERVKEIVFQKAEEARQKTRIEKLRQKLEKKWHVIYITH